MREPDSIAGRAPDWGLAAPRRRALPCTCLASRYTTIKAVWTVQNGLRCANVERGDRSPACGGTAGAAMDVRGAHQTDFTRGGMPASLSCSRSGATSGQLRRSAPIQSGVDGPCYRKPFAAAFHMGWLFTSVIPQHTEAKHVRSAGL